MTTPHPEQPPLTTLSHLWRYALCVVISAVGWGSVIVGQWQEQRTLFWLDLAIGLVAYVLVLFRRRRPLPIALVLTAAAGMSGLTAGPSVLAAVSLASRRDYRQIALVALVSFSAGEVFTTVQPQYDEAAWWVDATVNLVATVAILGWGLYIGSRRALLWTLRDQVAQAEEKLRLRSDQARTAERSRIAREMHDVLAHRISQISMQANAVMFREDLDTGQLRSSVAVIQQQANEALVELRGVLGVLRDPENGTPLDRPQPTYGDIAALVAEAGAGGIPIDFHDRLDDGASVPELVGRTAYRMVQESLTNARKHAPGALVTVTLEGDPRAGLNVTVTNPLGFGSSGAPESGLGLVGLRERIELVGGRLDVGRHGTHWQVKGWIPWES